MEKKNERFLDNARARLVFLEIAEKKSVVLRGSQRRVSSRRINNAQVLKLAKELRKRLWMRHKAAQSMEDADEKRNLLVGIEVLIEETSSLISRTTKLLLYRLVKNYAEKNSKVHICKADEQETLCKRKISQKWVKSPFEPGMSDCAYCPEILERDDDAP